MRFFPSLQEKFIKDFFIDLLIVGVILLTGWFLIGYYTQYNFLETGYQDWIYHSFRIKSLLENGFISWDHIWSNGINYWRSYQYLPHLLVILLQKITNLGITQSMIWTTVLVFLSIRVLTYMLLRALNVRPLFAFATVIASFVFPQQWVTIKDFSVYMLIFTVPIYIYIWIRTLKQSKNIFLLSSLTGFGWMLHPILGYSATGLLACILIFSSPRISSRNTLISLIIFLLSSAAFWVPYLFYGYSYSNPIMSSSQFLRDTLVDDHMGLGLLHWLGFLISWTIVFLKTGKISRWAKILLLYVTVYLALIKLGQSGYLPTFINQLQFSRGIIIVGYVLPFIFAECLQIVLQHIRSRFVIGIFATLVAAVIMQAITISSQYTATPVSSMEDPVAKYLNAQSTQGSIYSSNVSQASYFSNKLRFVNSYNEHLEPHPLAQRFRKLMASDLSYTSVSGTQIRLINSYSQVLGVQYLFLPYFSPLADALANPEQTENIFLRKSDVEAGSEKYQVLENKNPVVYSFLGDSQQMKSSISFEDFKQPTLHADSFSPWDSEVTKMKELLNIPSIKPVSTSFLATDRIRVNLPEQSFEKPQSILLMQSYDRFWSVVDHPELKIQPTSLRMMYLELPANFLSKEVILKNSWPNWYWPVQIGSILVTFYMCILYALISVFMRNLK